MAHRRGELVPIAEALANLPGPAQALRPERPPQRGFTRFDQVNQLVEASEADADLGFMARLLALCSLPRTNPRQPDTVCPAQRSGDACDECWRDRLQTSLR